MKACQLCGAKLWGPVKQTNELPTSITMFLLGKNGELYVRCDVCSAVALKELVDGPEPLIATPLVPGSVDSLSAAQSIVKNLFPKPETRTERLLRAFLQSNHEMDAQSLVAYIVDIETALDNKTEVKTATERSHDLFPVFDPVRVCMTLPSFKRYLVTAIEHVSQSGWNWISFESKDLATELTGELERVVNE